MRHIGIVGVPMDLGAGRRGVDMGPSAIRYAGLEKDLRALDLEVTDYNHRAVPGPENAVMGDPRAKYETQIEATCLELEQCVADMARAVSSVSSEVVSVRTYSIRRMTGTGFMKCMPSTFSGRWVAVAI